MGWCSVSMYTVENFLDDYREHDPDEILDILHINTDILLDRFDDKILEFIEKENLESDQEEESL